jgi:hypothetical protein
MPQIQDHPIIRNMELTGCPDGREPKYPICPKCGEEASSFYVSADKEVIGCDNCVESRDAWEMTDDEEDCEGYD